MTGATLNLTRRESLVGGAAAMLSTRILAAGPQADPIAVTRAGRFIGERTLSCFAFRGIRYGKAQRFQAPVSIAPIAEPVRAVEPGPACPQRTRRQPQSEDCLSLNIWTPTLDRRAKLPVMVWVHGGAYAYGSANDPITDGQRLSTVGNVVVVGINHRLNVFGYLFLARVDARFADSGNVGQLDLILALQWVRDNIGAFGGDPASVTLFGQSGGGAKIATLMAMPAARGLFSRAITMSGQQVTVSGPVHASQRTSAYLKRLGVRETELEKLRILPTQAMLSAIDAEDPIEHGPLYMGPVLDDRWLKRHPFWPDANPTGLEVSMMLGGTRDETRDFLDPSSPAMLKLDWASLPDRLAAELPIDLLPEKIIAAYRARMPTASPADVYYAATTDGRSWRPQLIEAEARARAGRPAFVYQVDFASSTKPDRGAFHGIDIGLVFGTLEASDAWTGTGKAARALSALMQQRFVAFARTGTPNPPNLPSWHPYELPARTTMIFDGASHVEQDPRRWQRVLFASAPYTQPGT